MDGHGVKIWNEQDFRFRALALFLFSILVLFAGFGPVAVGAMATVLSVPALNELRVLVTR